MATLKIFTLDPRVQLPKFGTEQAACFDLAYQPWGKFGYDGFSAVNAPFRREFATDGSIKFMPGDRILVPTGLIFDIPSGYSLRTHPRSGMSYRNGLSLVNCEGVIDSDYYHETFVPLLNVSDVPFVLQMNERVAQAELVRLEKYTLEQTDTKPEQKTDRIGGFGSTDKKDKKTLDKPDEK